MTFAIADRSVVDHRVKAAERVDLARDLLCASDGLKVAHHDRLGLGKFSLGVSSAFRVAGVEDNSMSLFCEKFADHQAETGG
jgi:hypothetical protein